MADDGSQEPDFTINVVETDSPVIQRKESGASVRFKESTSEIAPSKPHLPPSYRMEQAATPQIFLEPNESTQQTREIGVEATAKISDSPSGEDPVQSTPATGEVSINMEKNDADKESMFTQLPPLGLVRSQSILQPPTQLVRRSSMKPTVPNRSNTMIQPTLASNTTATPNRLPGVAVPLAGSSTGMALSSQSVKGSQNLNPLFNYDAEMPIVKKPAKATKEKRKMSLGAALCIPPPPRIDNNMTFKKVLNLSMGALGIVYGDIGVSPIFVLKSIFSPFVAAGTPVDETLVFGSISFLIWVITVVCSVKYIIFVLTADKNGEGGTWALISLLPLDNDEHVLYKYRYHIFTLGMVAASFLLADGIIAPAICVLSAFEGVELYTNDKLPQDGTIALSCIVLFLLLMIQRFGTSKALKFYGPIMITWFLCIAIVGLYNIIIFNPAILIAISPHCIAKLFIENPQAAFVITSQVVLAVTGVEAMYADLGHFKTLPIRVSFLAIVYPAIILNYLGQGAYLLSNPGAESHPFFHSVPFAVKWVVLVLATLSAIIASQATISGCFTLIDQAISLGIFPNVKTVHTSSESAGAVYIPSYNNVLMLGSIILIIVFRDSESLANIFGIGVTVTMTCTTVFYILAMKYVWHAKEWQTYIFSITFILVDVFLFCASLRKVVSGGWITFIMGLLIFAIMYTWFMTNREITEALHERLLELNELRLHVKNIHRTKGTVVFVSNTDEDVPNVLRICAQQLRSLPENIVCMTAHSSTAPFIADEERVVFRTVDAMAGIYRLIISYGYAERSINTVLAVERARKRGLRMAADERATFVVGRELVKTRADEKGALKKLRVLAFSAISSNTEGKIEYFNLPARDTLEIGAQMLI
ncbi:potassium transporter-domain-containing protein [Chytriomyces sp. MP71]|nr:potassium transporter-domain-containing protein [Chytriomyces sp. MP71]